MSIKVKKSGAWQNVRNGGLAARGGGAWYFPGMVHRKMGPAGGGSWTDSGYRGPPRAPTGFRLTAWTYEKVNAAWDHPGGPIGIQQYHFEITDVNNSPILGWHTTNHYFNMTDTTHSLSHDTQYHARVRSLSYEGLYSDWTYIAPTGRFGIGHPPQYAQHLVTYERPYYGSSPPVEEGGVYGWRDEALTLYVPPNVWIDTLWFWAKASWSAGWISIPETGRRMYSIRNGDIKWDEGAWTFNADPYQDYAHGWVPDWSTGSTFGFLIWGDGWSERPATLPQPGYFISYGQIQVWGVEQYQQWETYQTVEEKGNYYW